MTDHGRSGISRRESFRRAGLIGLGSGLPFSFAAAAESVPWSMQRLDPVDAIGYGTDPDLIHPAPVPWPRTLTGHQIRTLSVLVDILIPADGDLPGASEVGTVEVIDEWISAPYPTQQQHRALVLSGLDWLDRASERRHGARFAVTAPEARERMVADIADGNASGPAELEGPRRFFSVLRSLTVGAYYTSPEGVRELGYQGNVAIAGDYPGPSREAMAHLEAQLEELGLSLD